MRTENICLGAAAAIGAQILWLSSAPYPPAAPFSVLWNFLAYASLTLLLWIAARGRRPLAVPGGVILLGACVGDPALAAAAAVLTAATLFFLQGKPAPIARL
ncbi:MAG TPA: hypothetical protein VNP36_19195 [Burkholderiales bacterium]|nr:hypothetical protein [Burkholderiales bacterium]